MVSPKEADQALVVDTHTGELAGADRRVAGSATRIPAGAPGGMIARALPGDAATGENIAPQRVRGRPRGATNIRDTAAAAELIARYGDPLEADLAIGNAKLGELITELRCIASDRGLQLGGTVMEIARWQAQCRSNAMPYVRGKRAQVNEAGDPVLPIIGIGRVDNLNISTGGRSIEDMVEVIDAVAEVVEDQGVSDEQPPKSHDE